ncbi:MAG: T9SS type A sorting domain-containing protein, partial [Bacteroidota bacterium]
ITAGSHLSGPYSISGIMREVMIEETPYNFLAYLPNTFLSYNYVYGLYDDLEEFFKPAYIEDIQAFFDGDIGLFTLNNRLIADVTAAHGAPIARYLMQDSIIAIMEGPTSDHPLRQALIDNDVYEWAPQEPTRIFYCTADDQVHFRNSIVADSVMQLLGAVDLTTQDVDTDADHGDCVDPAVFQTILFFAGLAEWVVATEETAALQAVQLFPNPTTDGEVMVSGLTETATLALFDLNGRQRWRGVLTAGQTRLRLPALPASVYGLVVETPSGRTLRKLVISR